MTAAITAGELICGPAGAVAVKTVARVKARGISPNPRMKILEDIRWSVCPETARASTRAPMRSGTQNATARVARPT